MTFADLVEYAFVHGCGVTTAEVVQTARFRERLGQQLALYETYPQRTVFGRALRQGYYATAQSLQSQIWQSKAAPIPKTSIRSNEELLYQRALLWELGHHLIITAQRQLPQELTSHDAENSWLRLSIDERREEMECAYHILSRLDNQVSVDPMLVRKSIRAHRVLPQQFSLTDNHPEWPNCLGISILMLAWGRFIGAPVLFTTQVHDAVEYYEPSEFLVSRTILRDMERRGLPKIEPFVSEVRKSLNCTRERTWNRTLLHHGAVFQISGGTWVYMDNYDLGVLTEKHWKVGGVNRLLREYEAVLPGLTIVAHDGGQLRNTYRRLRREVYQSLMDSEHFWKAVHEYFSDGPTEMWDFIGFCNRWGPLQKLYADSRPKQNDPPTPTQLFLAGLTLTNHLPQQFCKVIGEMGLRGSQLEDSFANNQVFRDACIARVVTEFHRFSREIYRLAAVEVRSTQYLELPPVLEFALPEMQVALFVLNHLRRWKREFVHIPTEALLQHSSSHLLWQQTACRTYARTASQKRLLWKGEAYVRSLRPFIHPGSVYYLSRIDLESEAPDAQT